VTLLPASGGTSILPGNPGGSAAVTLRVGSGDLPAGGQVRVPVEILGAQNVHAATVRVRYDANQLQPDGLHHRPQGICRSALRPGSADGWPCASAACDPLAALLAAGSDVQYHWDFGDGTTRIAGPNVSHVYGAAGNYTVRVTATTGGFADVTATTPVVVVDNAIPGRLTPPATTGCRVETNAAGSALVLDLRARNKHGASGSLLPGRTDLPRCGRPAIGGDANPAQPDGAEPDRTGLSVAALRHHRRQPGSLHRFLCATCWTWRPARRRKPPT
jgi:hypothetical protein